MKTIKFKTDIKCSGCIAKVTPSLNAVAGENQWQVDVANAEKILTITNENISEKQILDAIEQAGFKGKKVS